MTKRFVFNVKGHSSARGQSHFSEIDTKLAIKKNEFVTHFVKKMVRNA